eukprot:gene11292-11095_t
MREFEVSRTVVREAMSRLQAAKMVETRHGVGTFVLELTTEHPLLGKPAGNIQIQQKLAMLELRISIESDAASLAAMRHTDRHLKAMRAALDAYEAHLNEGSPTIDDDYNFHIQIAAATGNVYFEEVLSNLGSATMRGLSGVEQKKPFGEPLMALASGKEVTQREHEAIYDAIRRGDSAAARAAMFMHLTNSRERLRDKAGKSSVTLSGRVDLGLQHAPNDLSKGTDNVSGVNESSNGRLNIAGREQISGDLTAFFMMEARFNADTGAQSDATTFFKDKSWMGLESKSLGEIRMGRLHSPQYGISTAGRYEAFSGDSYASMGSRGALSANQWNNSIAYTTPTFNGFNAGVIWQAGEKLVANGSGVFVSYNQGPLSMAASYQKEQDKMVTTAIDTMETKALGAYYDFGVVRLSTTYARSTKVNLTHVPSVEPLNTLHAFKFKAPAGRALYVRVPANLEAIGGYLAKNPTASLIS